MQEQAIHMAEVRRARRLTQREVADAVGVTDQTISNIERGETRPDIDLGLALARFYGLPVEDLFAPSVSTEDVEAQGIDSGSPPAPAATTAPSSPSVAPTPGDGTGGGTAVGNRE